jgi:hypothetical protein
MVRGKLAFQAAILQDKLQLRSHQINCARAGAGSQTRFCSPQSLLTHLVAAILPQPLVYFVKAVLFGIAQLRTVLAVDSDKCPLR